jgi:hypothetical protein
MVNNEYILNKFPEINLSYDKILHRKVYSDLYFLIPKGKKGFLWFTYKDKHNICYFLELNKYNKIIGIYNQLISFDKELSYNTIIYGTLYNKTSVNYFSCENIFYFKGDYVGESLFIDKFKIMRDIFDNYINEKIYTNNFLYIGIPYFTDNNKEIYKNIPFMHYEVSHITFINLNETNISGIILNNKDIQIKECIFKVKASIKDDLYELYCNNNYLYGHALIMDYKKSILMNTLFRNIKENYNLDLLEESDEEDDFENINIDKYVDVKKEIYMKCKYNMKFKKWEPIEKCNKEKLFSYKEIQKLEQN